MALAATSDVSSSNVFRGMSIKAKTPRPDVAVVRTSKKDEAGRAFEAVRREWDIACRPSLPYLILRTVKDLAASVAKRASICTKRY